MGATPPPKGVSAGEVTLLKSGATLLKITPAVDGTYATTVTPSADWGAGDAVTFHAAGGAIPPFEQTLTGPGLVVLAEPVVDGGSIPLSRATDLTLRWQATAGRVSAGIGQGPSAAKNSSTALNIYCDFDGASGTAKIPAAALGALAPTAGFTGQTTLFFGGVATTDVTPGGYSVRVQLANITPFVLTVQ
jgi:hypothetical protein